MKWLKKVATTPLTSIAKVIDSLSSTTNDRTNAPSIHAVNEAINNNWLTIYPIGSIYMSVNNNDPSLIFGGTWQQIKDKFLLANGDTYAPNTTGGAATKSYTPTGTVGNHTLTVTEMPAHTHNVIGHAIVGGNDKLITEYTPAGVEVGSATAGIQISGTMTQLALNATAESQGGGGAHNHTFTGTAADINVLPPYMTVYVWVRTA